MTEKSNDVSKTVLDPLFAIPRGAEGSFVHSQETIFTGASEDLEASDEFSGDATISEVDESYGPDEDIVMPVPTELSIISQVLRRAPGGQQVVDVIASVEDIPGAVSYEFRVTKI